MDLPISPLTGSRRACSRKVLQKSWLVASEKKRFSNSRCLKASCWSSPVSSVTRDDEALFRKQLGGDVGAGVDHGGVDQIAVLHAIEQRVAEGRLAGFAAEGAVGVQQQAAFGLARIAAARLGAVETAQVVARRGGEAELVADEVIEHGAGVAADGAVRLVGNHQIEVGRREQALVFVVEQQRLHGGDDDLGAAPVVAVFLVDDGLEVGGQQARKGLFGLVFEFEAIDQKQHPPGVAGAQVQLDDGGGGEGLAGAGGHLEQEAVPALADRPLQRMDGLELVGPQEAQLVGLDVGRALGRVLPAGFRLRSWALREDDVVVADFFVRQPRRVGRDLLVADHRLRGGKGGDDVGVAALQIPEVMQVAVGENDEAAVLRAGVFAGLLLADQRVLVLGLGLQHQQRKALGIQQQEIDEALAGGLEVVAQRVEIVGFERDAGLKPDIGRQRAVGEEAPAGRFQQAVDLDAGGGFLGHINIHAIVVHFIGSAPWT